MNLTVQILRSFDAELQKQAAPVKELALQAVKALQSRAGSSAALGGAGAMLGGLTGAGVGGIRGYRDAREVGATRGQALTYALTDRALKGAGKGALVGGAAGAGAGLLGGSHAAGLADKVVGSSVLGAPARFAQRQVHSLTGYASPEQVRAMRGGAYDAFGQLSSAREGVHKAIHGDLKPGMVDKLLGRSPVEARSQAVKGALKGYDRALAGASSAEKAEQMGLTSVPGYLKNLVQRPGETLRHGIGAEWSRAGLGGKAMMVGMPLSSAHAALKSSREQGEPGASKSLKALGSMAGFSLAPMGFAGQGAMSAGLGAAAGLAGKGIDKALTLRKRRNLADLPDSSDSPADERADSVQRFQTPQSLGRAPEGIMA